ncbi:hypothetical protein R1sor_007577 [Riccia sorocarpa]|uniref:Uncharacterized protein n=1 Tax=Riccia sorocarpa TaxID=122646 RepID=A0ABD3HV06_9MARC
MAGENQPVDSFYSEVTPKPLKKVKKFVMEMSEDEKTPSPTPSVADPAPPPQPEVRDMEMKEIRETFFPKYLATLRSKIEDVTRIAELEAHMEGLGLDVPEKVTPSPTEALRDQLLTQMEGLARVLLGEEKEGPTSSFKWNHGSREELMALVAIPDSSEVEIGGSSSS